MGRLVRIILLSLLLAAVAVGASLAGLALWSSHRGLSQNVAIEGLVASFSTFAVALLAGGIAIVALWFASRAPKLRLHTRVDLNYIDDAEKVILVPGQVQREAGVVDSDSKSWLDVGPTLWITLYNQAECTAQRPSVRVQLIGFQINAQQILLTQAGWGGANVSEGGVVTWIWSDGNVAIHGPDWFKSLPPLTLCGLRPDCSTGGGITATRSCIQIDAVAEGARTTQVISVRPQPVVQRTIGSVQGGSGMRQPIGDDKSVAGDPVDRASSARVTSQVASGSATPPPASPSVCTTSGPFGQMPRHILFFAVAYLAALVGMFIAYFTSPWLRMHIPANLGPLPVGVVWFGATGAVMVSLYGIFVYNQEWNTSYNYWHYCRPLFGAVTGSIGALMYLVLLHLGSSSRVKVDPLTFYVVAFVLGFADKSFMQLLKGVTTVIVKPGTQSVKAPQTTCPPSAPAVAPRTGTDPRSGESPPASDDPPQAPTTPEAAPGT